MLEFTQEGNLVIKPYLYTDLQLAYPEFYMRAVLNDFFKRTINDFVPVVDCDLDFKPDVRTIRISTPEEPHNGENWRPLIIDLFSMRTLTTDYMHTDSVFLCNFLIFSLAGKFKHGHDNKEYNIKMLEECHKVHLLSKEYISMLFHYYMNDHDPVVHLGSESKKIMRMLTIDGYELTDDYLFTDIEYSLGGKCCLVPNFDNDMANIPRIDHLEINNRGIYTAIITLYQIMVIITANPAILQNSVSYHNAQLRDKVVIQDLKDSLLPIVNDVESRLVNDINSNSSKISSLKEKISSLVLNSDSLIAKIDEYMDKLRIELSEHVHSRLEQKCDEILQKANESTNVSKTDTTTQDSSILLLIALSMSLMMIRDDKMEKMINHQSTLQAHTRHCG